MLATLAAVHLLAFAQLEGAPAPRSIPPPDAAEEPRARADRAPVPPPPGQRQLSLLSAEALEGGSMAMAWAGWSSLGAMWAQGVTARDDLGLVLELDWAGTELHFGGWYRRALGTAGGFDVAGRLGLAWYADFGNHLIHEGNHDDRGLELQPGVVWSVRGGGGVFSAIGELPITITTRGDGGALFIPRASLAWETPIYPELNVGVQGGIGYRVGTGDAPMRDGRVDVRFLVVAGWQVL